MRVRRSRPDVPVQLAFLEFMSPDVSQAGDELAAAGCTAVQVLPLFLGAGGHVRKDLPELLAQLSARHPHVSWQLQPAVGGTTRVIAAMAEAAMQLLTNPSTDP